MNENSSSRSAPEDEPSRGERTFLYEHEVYERIEAAGLGMPPRWGLVPAGGDSVDFGRHVEEVLRQIPGERVVLKIVHPRIAHKTDVGGVRIVARVDVAATVTEMLRDVPARLASSLEKENDPTRLGSLLATSLAEETVGILVVENVQGVPGFATELFLGVRWTREFGPILTLGVGGLQTELLAGIAREDTALAITSPLVATTDAIWRSFARTVSHTALCKGLRGQSPCVTEPELRRLVERWCDYARRDAASSSSEVLGEMEVNPFVFRDNRAVALDGLLRFVPRPALRVRPRREDLGHLFHPVTVGLIGVSTKGTNVGRIILGNLLAGGFDPQCLVIVKPGESTIDGVPCVPSVGELPWRCDLFIISIAAGDVRACVSDVIRERKADAMLLITGGMGETKGGANLEAGIAQLLRDARAAANVGDPPCERGDDHGCSASTSPRSTPVLVGGNSLGILSEPGKLDTLFIPEAKLPRRPDQPLGRNVALLSQSGAFLISRQSALGGFVPRYAASTGNQIDVGIADLLHYFAEDPSVDVIGCYLEGFRDGEGLDVARATVDAVAKGKRVLVYKAGRTPAGRTAARGHTAALAGDWDVARAVLSSAGTIFCERFREWSSLLLLSSLLARRSPGAGRLAAVSNAGYESVGLADHLPVQGFLRWARFAEPLQVRLRGVLEKHGLAGLQDVRNPLDVTPMAGDAAHIDILEALAESEDVDVLIAGCVPLTAAMKTTAAELSDPGAYANQIAARWAGWRKPLVVVVDSGAEYDAMTDRMQRAGVPVLRSADDAVSLLDRWAAAGAEACAL